MRECDYRHSIERCCVYFVAVVPDSTHLALVAVQIIIVVLPVTPPRDPQATHSRVSSRPIYMYHHNATTPNVARSLHQCASVAQCLQACGAPAVAQRVP